LGRIPLKALHWLVADDSPDLVVSGGTPEQVVEKYRKITGFSSMPPVWSFGMWMSRSTYTSAGQVSEVARHLRTEAYPADVLHLDVGWFEEDWRCSWQFSKEKYPDPAGFQVSLWQAPYIHLELSLTETALEAGIVGRETSASHRHWLGYTLDFTRFFTSTWYQSLPFNSDGHQLASTQRD